MFTQLGTARQASYSEVAMKVGELRKDLALLDNSGELVTVPDDAEIKVHTEETLDMEILSIYYTGGILHIDVG